MSSGTPTSEIKQYGIFLVGERPKSVSNADWKSDVWILEFENPIDRTKLGPNYKYFKNQIPRWLFFTTDLNRIKNDRENATTRKKSAWTQDGASENMGASSKTLFISNLSFSRPVWEIEQYGGYLAGARPRTVEKSQTHANVWVLEFEKAVDQTALRVNYKQQKHLIPKKLFFATDLSQIKTRSDYAANREDGDDASSTISTAKTMATVDTLPDSDNEDDEDADDDSQDQDQETSSKRIFISNVSSNMPTDLIKKYGKYLTGTEPTRIGQSKSRAAVWILEFENPIDLSTLKQNHKKHRSLIPTRLFFSLNLDNARKDTDCASVRRDDEPERRSSISAVETSDAWREKAATSSSSKTLFISNMSFGKPTSEIEKYGTFLTGDRPKTVEKSRTHDNTWILEFDNPLVQAKLRSNHKQHKNQIPVWLFYSTDLSKVKIKNSDNPIIIRKRELSQSSTASVSTAPAAAIVALPEKKTTQTNVNSSKTLFLSNLSFTRPVAEIEQYGTYLAGVRPKSVQKSKIHNEVWILEFDNLIDKRMLNMNLQLHKHSIPSRLFYALSLDDIRTDWPAISSNVPSSAGAASQEVKPPKPKVNVEQSSKFWETPAQSALKYLEIPDSVMFDNSELIKLSMLVFKYTYDLSDIRLDKQETSRVLVEGNPFDVDTALAAMRKAFSCIRCRRVDGFSFSVAECNKLSSIIKQALNSLFLTYTIKIRSSDIEQDSGIFVSYFHDVAELCSNEDTTYQEVCKTIKANICSFDLNLTSYSAMLKTAKWTEFERKHLSDEAFSNKFVYALTWNAKPWNGQHRLHLTGLKDYLLPLKTKMLDFFQLNNSLTKEIVVKEHEFWFLKFVCSDLHQRMKSQYEAEMEFQANVDDQSYTIMVNGCTVNNRQAIENDIRSVCKLIQLDKLETEYLPGLAYLFSDMKANGIEASLDKIQKETKTRIYYDLEKKTSQADAIASTSRLTLDSTPKPVSTPTCIRVGTNSLSLRIGDIIMSSTQVFLNTSTTNLNLKSGVLSRNVLAAAGPSIQFELKVKYPAGIAEGEIAVSTAGLIKAVDSIYHSAFPHYSSDQHSIQIIESAIANCFTHLKQQNLKSITLPTIGAGQLGHPGDLVAQTMTNAIMSHFRKNLNECLDVAICVYEKDLKTAQLFQAQFQELLKETWVQDSKKTNTGSTTTQQRVFQTESHRAVFAITYLDLDACSQAKKAIEKLIHGELIIKDHLQNDLVKFIDNNELEKVAKEFVNCSIEPDYGNKRINLHGHKPDVINAKLKLTSMINTLMNAKFSQSKKIQWQYQNGKKEWTDFSFYLNCFVEEKYLENKNGICTFLNEDEQESKIFFAKMSYVCQGQSFTVRRYDLTKTSGDFGVVFPDTWTPMKEGEFLELVKVDPDSKEYKDVVTDFSSKLSRHSSYNVVQSLERIQNKMLYRQYLTHKQNMVEKGKQPNEMNLFHGTAAASIDKICKTGFNRSYCGVNGVAYGHGVYFATESSVSNGYSLKGAGLGGNQMIRARVLVGETMLGNSSMKVAPAKPDGDHYDSTSNGTGSIYVCYHDSQCLPEYLITYV